MSVCGQNGQAEDDSVSEDVSAAVREKPSDTYKQKPASKVVRVLTVLAYLLSVSLAAILLSVYYMCVWKSPELPQSETAARRVGPHSFGTIEHTTLHIIGGGDTAVNGSTIPPPENITSGYTNISEDDSTTETSAQNYTVFDTTMQGPGNDTSDDIGTQSTIDNVT